VSTVRSSTSVSYIWWLAIQRSNVRTNDRCSRIVARLYPRLTNCSMKGSMWDPGGPAPTQSPLQRFANLSHVFLLSDRKKTPGLCRLRKRLARRILYPHCGRTRGARHNPGLGMMPKIVPVQIDVGELPAVHAAACALAGCRARAERVTPRPCEWCLDTRRSARRTRTPLDRRNDGASESAPVVRSAQTECVAILRPSRAAGLLIC
jgi:hypothetical protein